MGFFSKLFGGKENKEPEKKVAEENKVESADNNNDIKLDESSEVSAQSVEQTAEDNVQEENTSTETAEFDTEKESLKNADTEEDAKNDSSNVAKADTIKEEGGQIDLSKWRVQPNGEDNAPNAQPTEGQMQVLLNCVVGDDESLTDERRKELIEQTFKGPEGVKMFGQNTLIENLFIVSYMQNVMIPKAVEAKNENDAAVFNNLVGLYSRMLTAKVLKLQKWVAIGSNNTGFPFEMGKMAFVLIQDKHADFTVDMMEKENKFSVSKNEIANEHFLSFIDFLRKCGYAGVAISDGKHPGVGLPLEFFYLDGNAPKLDNQQGATMENPLLLGAMISFMQEMRRGVDIDKDVPENERDGYRKMLSSLQGQMFYQIANAHFVLPSRKDENGREANPIFQNQEKTEKMLAVYTDIQEMSRVFPVNDGWVPIPTPFEKVADMVNAMGGNGFLINNASISVPVMKEVMNHILQMKAQEAKAKAEKDAEANNVDSKN